VHTWRPAKPCPLHSVWTKVDGVAVIRVVCVARQGQQARCTSNTYSCSMALQHYLPAAYLGRFSEDVSRPMRERKLWALRRGGRRVFGSAAGKIAGQQDMYVLGKNYGWPANGIDDIWGGYEAGLSSALDLLCDPASVLVDAALWLRHLIPFAAGMFVRTPDMNQRYEPGIAEFFADAQDKKDQTNVARATALGRFLAPVMAARWYVLHLPTDLSLLVNDCGVANVDLGKDLGWIIPVGPNQVLALEPMPDGYRRDIMVDMGNGEWRVVVHHIELDMVGAAGINDAITDAAMEFVIGGSKQEVEAQIPRFTTSRPREEVDLRMLSTNRMQIVHSFDWHRAVTAIQYPAENPQIREFDIDFDFLTRGWYPPILFPTNVPIFNVGLTIHDKVIAMGMAEVPGFTDGSPPPWPWEASP
jgi:hypothetical protein